MVVQVVWMLPSFAIIIPLVCCAGRKRWVCPSRKSIIPILSFSWGTNRTLLSESLAMVAFKNVSDAHSNCWIGLQVHCSVSITVIMPSLPWLQGENYLIHTHVKIVVWSRNKVCITPDWWNLDVSWAICLVCVFQRAISPVLVLYVYYRYNYAYYPDMREFEEKS